MSKIVAINLAPDSPRASSTISRIFSADPGAGSPSSRASTCWSEHSFSFLQPYQEDPKPIYESFASFSFILKVVQLSLIIICMGLYSKGLYVVHNSITSQQLPNIVFAAYMIITSVILLSYLLGQKMPELLIRVFNLLGAILFVVTGVVSLHICMVYRLELRDIMEENAQSDLAYGFSDTDNVNASYASSDNATIFNSLSDSADIANGFSSNDDGINGFSDDYASKRVIQSNMLLAEGILSIIVGALYLIDVVWSVKRTLSLL